MMSAHTQGPWFVEDETRVYANEYDGMLASTWTRSVPDDREEGESWLAMRCRTKPQRDVADAECKANARLIAVAPDLLKIAGRLMRVIEAGIPDLEDVDCYQMAKELLAKIDGGAA